MVSLRVATPVALEAYYRGVANLMEWYPSSWPEISVAEELVRKEQWALMLENGLRTKVTNAAGEETTFRTQDSGTWDSIIKDSAFRAAGQGELGDWWVMALTKPLDQAGRMAAAPPPPITNDTDGSLVYRSGAGNQGKGGGDGGNGKGGKNRWQPQQEQPRGQGNEQTLFGHGCPNCGEEHTLHDCGLRWGPTVTRVWRSLGQPDANAKGGKNKGGRGNGNGDKGRGRGRGRGYPPADDAPTDAPEGGQRDRRNGRRGAGR